MSPKAQPAQFHLAVEDGRALRPTGLILLVLPQNRPSEIEDFLVSAGYLCTNPGGSRFAARGLFRARGQRTYSAVCRQV